MKEIISCISVLLLAYLPDADIHSLRELIMHPKYGIAFALGVGLVLGVSAIALADYMLKRAGKPKKGKWLALSNILNRWIRTGIRKTRRLISGIRLSWKIDWNITIPRQSKEDGE